MKKQFKGLIIALISITVLTVVVLLIISINRPYYYGFERRLDYLSPDLSEAPIEFNETLFIEKPSEIKIIFEIKDWAVPYSLDDFNSFVLNLSVQIWNENEYISLNRESLKYMSQGNRYYAYFIGEIKGGQTYRLFIRSYSGINSRYKIGIGIGKGSLAKPLGNNLRRFY